MRERSVFKAALAILRSVSWQAGLAIALVTSMAAVSILGGSDPASAATMITVDDSADSASPSGQGTTLREAFDIANNDGDDSVISLQAGVEYTLDSCSVGELGHSAIHDLTIEGNGATIYQTCRNKKILTNLEPSSTLTVRNLTLTGGFVPDGPIYGAAISVKGPLRLTNTNVRFIDAGPAGSVIDGGNGFDGERSDIKIEGGLFGNNTGIVVILRGGPVSITGAEISNNQGSGVALVDGHPLTIEGSSITDNTGLGVKTTGQGGAVLAIFNSVVSDNGDSGVTCSMCGDVLLDNVTVARNGRADGAQTGGGVVITTQPRSKTRTFHFINSSVIDNFALAWGGGVYLQTEGIEPGGDIAPPVAIFDNTKVNGNTAIIGGGGILARAVDVELRNGSQLVANTASGVSAGGGGIRISASEDAGRHPDLTIGDSQVKDNTANGRGGGLWVLSEGEVVIERTVVTGNQARRGGGYSVSGAKTTIDKSFFGSNEADVGGGVAVLATSRFRPGSIAISNSTFADNSATSVSGGDGGGLYLGLGRTGVTASIMNSTFTQNVAARRGGGIAAVDKSSAQLGHVTLADNSAPEGANLFVESEILSTWESVFVSPLGGQNCGLSAPTSSSSDNFATDASCDLTAFTDVVSVMSAGEQARLHGPLGDNGGPTPTRLPSSTAPFLDSIAETRCTDAVDQRGAIRPQGAGCDPGSIEVAGSEPDLTPDVPTPLPIPQPVEEILEPATEDPATEDPATEDPNNLDMGAQPTFEDLFDRYAWHQGHSVVLRLYWAVLGRQPELGGAQFWLNSYDSSDWSTRRIASFFAQSDEFKVVYGPTLSDAEFVTVVYGNVLGRAPDADGYAFWVKEIAAGMSRGEMILLVSNAPEFIDLHPLVPDSAPDTGPLGIALELSRNDVSVLVVERILTGKPTGRYVTSRAAASDLREAGMAGAFATDELEVEVTSNCNSNIQQLLISCEILLKRSGVTVAALAVTVRDEDLFAGDTRPDGSPKTGHPPAVYFIEVLNPVTR